MWVGDRNQLYLLLLDIDQFKSINDAHGHAAGDAVLQRVASCVAASIGARGAAGRFGGEEFVAWFRTDQPQMVAEQALDAIRQTR